MFGGYYHPTDSALGDTWAYVPSTDTWVRKADGPGARQAHMAVWNSKDNLMIVFGGRSLTYGQYGWWTDTWVYDPERDQWHQKANMPSPLAQASAVWDPLHNIVIVFGGETVKDNNTVHGGETWIYDPTLDKWTVLNMEIQPSPRNWLQAAHVWDALNNQMILFGGNAATGYLNDLWTFRVSHSASIDLTPSSGFAAATVVGSGFSTNSKVTITWDGTNIPTVPSPLITDANGNFTALISVPTQNALGSHTVKAADEAGIEASATFTVIDITGPAEETEDFQLIVNVFTSATSILALCLSTIALFKKKT